MCLRDSTGLCVSTRRGEAGGSADMLGVEGEDRTGLSRGDARAGEGRASERRRESVGDSSPSPPPCFSPACVEMAFRACANVLLPSARVAGDVGADESEVSAREPERELGDEVNDGGARRE